MSGVVEGRGRVGSVTGYRVGAVKAVNVVVIGELNGYKFVKALWTTYKFKERL